MIIDRIALIISIIGGLNWGSIDFSVLTLSHGSSADRTQRQQELFIRSLRLQVSGAFLFFSGREKRRTRSQSIRQDNRFKTEICLRERAYFCFSGIE